LRHIFAKHLGASFETFFKKAYPNNFELGP